MATLFPSTLLRVGSLVGLVMVVGTLALVHGPWAVDSAVPSDAVSTLGSVLAALCCVYAARRSSATARRSWLLFGSTMAMWSVADVMWFVVGVDGGLQPLIGLTDPLYLLGLVPMCAGLLLFPVGTWERGAAPRLVLDGLVLGSALLLISYLVVLREVIDLVGRSWDAFEYGVYPFTDILLAGLATLLVLRSAGRPRPDLVLLGLAFAAWTVGDNGYALLSARGEDYSQTLVAVCYVAAPVLLALAALCRHGTEPDDRTVQRNAPGAIAAVLPDVAAVCAVALCLVRGLDDWRDWTLAALTLTLTGIRQLATTSDSHSLRQDLESRVADRTEELERLSARHQRILESVGEGIFGVDEAGRISFVNPAAERMLGWEPSGLLGRHACSTLCTEVHGDCPLTMVMELGDRVTQSETAYRRRDGSRVPVEITATPKVGTHGFSGAVVAFRDVSERHVVDLMKHEFVSAVSHELRTPLTAIRGSLEMLADGEAGRLPDRAQEIVAMAERGSERLTRLVNDIIDVERLETGAFTVRPTPQDVRPLVESTVSSMVAMAEQAQVRLVIGPVDGRALCDADRVVQALVNLVGNAVKFTRDGGTVQITATPEQHEVVFAVTDEGLGIPESELGPIFERFHQVQGDDSPERGGSGLGLTITKSIVERHGGRIWVESERGVGSTFRFALPMAGAGVAPSRT